MPRKILHLDLDAFFCAVEELRDPSLAGKPFAVGGRPGERGVVASCSYPARLSGIHSAMPMSRAVQLCPSLIIVEARHDVYGDMSHQVMERVRNLTPLVEQVSIDEAFLDVSDLPDSAETTARKLQSRIHTDLNLPCSLGVATNKLLAKIANDVGKASSRKGSPPNAITVVPPGEEAAFLAPLPVLALWGVGAKTATHLAELGIHTIGDLASWPEATLVDLFGKSGHDLASRAKGLDDNSIVTSRAAKSISQETTFNRDIKDIATLHKTLRSLTEGVGRQLRQAHLRGNTIKLKIRWPDFTTLTRQETLEQPVDQDQEIYQAALKLFEKVWQPGRPVRLLGVGASGLGPPVRQLTFWDSDHEKDRRLQSALDMLRERYGNRAILRGSEMKFPPST
ncbi:MAG: DNA polymerase IV [Omnitrophica WOR_2 bacterium]